MGMHFLTKRHRRERGPARPAGDFWAPDPRHDDRCISAMADDPAFDPDDAAFPGAVSERAARHRDEWARLQGEAGRPRALADDRPSAKTRYADGSDESTPMDPDDDRHPIFTDASKAHVEKLREGVAAWNEWRAEHPMIRPDLQGVDFTHEYWHDTPIFQPLETLTDWARERLPAGEPGQINLEGINLSRAVCRYAHFEGAYCGGAHFEGAYCPEAYFGSLGLSAYRNRLSAEDLSLSRGADETDDQFERRLGAARDAFVEKLPKRFKKSIGKPASLWGADFSPLVSMLTKVNGASLTVSGQIKGDPGNEEIGLLKGQVDLPGNDLTSKPQTQLAMLFGADLSGVYMRGANFTGAEMNEANVTGADFSHARFDGADVTDVAYDSKKLAGRCRGVQAETCFGNALFRRDVLDQDYLDSLKDKIEKDPVVWQDVRRNTLFGLLIGGLVAWLTTAGDIGSLLRPSWDILDLTFLRAITGFAVPVLLGVGLSFRWGKRLVFRLWGITDYGRDFDRVLMIAFGLS